jgi:cupin fold WbuC family metalloprotein
MDLVSRVDRELIEEFITRSRSSSRLRNPKPLTTEDCKVQTLVNAIQPGSYARPHKHPHEEIWIHSRGRILLGLFDDQGNPNEAAYLSDMETIYFRVPPNIYHTVISLQDDSVFFNASPGPFDPSASKLFLENSPNEGDSQPEIRDYLQRMTEKFVAIQQSKRL